MTDWLTKLNRLNGISLVCVKLIERGGIVRNQRKILDV